jgi:hypothetical protein
MTPSHLEVLRSLAVEREKNRDITKYSLLNMQFCMESLNSFMDGDGVLQNYGSIATRRAADVRRKWQKAITKVLTAARSAM